MQRLLKAFGISILLLALVGMVGILADLFMLLTYQIRLTFGVGVAFGCLVTFVYFCIWVFDEYEDNYDADDYPDEEE